MKKINSRCLEIFKRTRIFFNLTVKCLLESIYSSLISLISSMFFSILEISLILFFINFLSDNFHSASGGKAEDDEGEGEGNSGDVGNGEEENEGEGEDSLLGKRKANSEPEEIDIDDV